jgi:hypothetical protein
MRVFFLEGIVLQVTFRLGSDIGLLFINMKLNEVKRLLGCSAV